MEWPRAGNPRQLNPATATDPETGQEVSLFNRRQDRWLEHLSGFSSLPIKSSRERRPASWLHDGTAPTIVGTACLAHDGQTRYGDDVKKIRMNDLGEPLQKALTDAAGEPLVFENGQGEAQYTNWSRFAPWSACRSDTRWFQMNND